MSHVDSVISPETLFNYGVSRQRSGITTIDGPHAFINNVETTHPDAGFLSLIKGDMVRVWELYTNGSIGSSGSIITDGTNNVTKQFFTEVTGAGSGLGVYTGVANYGIPGDQHQHVMILDTTNDLAYINQLGSVIDQSYRVRFEFDLRQRLYLEDPDFLFQLNQINFTMRQLGLPQYAGGVDIDETVFAPLGRIGDGNGYDFVGTLGDDGIWETHGNTGIPNQMYGWLKINIATSLQLMDNGDMTIVNSTEPDELTQLSNGQYLDGSVCRSPGEIVDLEFHDTSFPFDEVIPPAFIDMEMVFIETIPAALSTSTITFTTGLSTVGGATGNPAAWIAVGRPFHISDGAGAVIAALATEPTAADLDTPEKLALRFAEVGNTYYSDNADPDKVVFSANGTILTMEYYGGLTAMAPLFYVMPSETLADSPAIQNEPGNDLTDVYGLIYLPDSINNVFGGDYADGTYTINVTSTNIEDTAAKLIVTIKDGGIDTDIPPVIDEYYPGVFAATTTYEDIIIHYHEIPRKEKDADSPNSMKTRVKTKGRGWFKRFGKLESNVKGTYPMSYRLTMTERGFALGLWDDAGATENDDYAWVVCQRLVSNISGETRRDSAYRYPVHCLYSCGRESLYPRDFGIFYGTAAISSHTVSNEMTQVHDFTGNLYTLDHSEFNRSSGKTAYILDPFDKEDPLASDWLAKPIWRYVVREYDKLKPWDVHKSATKHETDSNAILNPMEQLSITDDNRFVITFPTGLTTQSFMYPGEEIDLICFSSAQVIAEGSTVPMVSYARGEDQIDKRRYFGIRSTLPNGNGMRVCILVSGDWILNTDINIDAHI
jgi:hypothetical protein